MEFDNKLKLKPAAITSANQTELEQLEKDYAKYFNEYLNYDDSKLNNNLKKSILPNLDRIVTRVTELVGDEKRFDILYRAVTKYGGK